MFASLIINQSIINNQPKIQPRIKNNQPKIKMQKQQPTQLTVQRQTQTQQTQPSTFLPKYSQSSVLSLPKDFYFQQFALYCSPRGKRTQQSGGNYQSNQILIAAITSLQQFFQYFLSIKIPSQLPDNSKITLFYKNCKPFWEEWLDSGCLLIKFRDCKQEEEKLLDIIWQFLCYALIGNNIDHDVIGIMLGKREKMTLVQIWLRNNDRAKDIGIQLEQQIRRELPPSLLQSINSIIKVKHKRHIDSINGNSTIKGAQNLTKVKIGSRTQLNNSF